MLTDEAGRKTDSYEYEAFGVEPEEVSGNLLQRNIIFGGSFFGWRYGMAFWLRGWVYTDNIIKDIDRVQDDNPNSSCNRGRKLLGTRTKCTCSVNSEELGIAIGNTANHEVGHMVGLDDEVANTDWIMSDAKTDEHK